MRRTTGTTGFLWSRFDVPRVFLALPQWPKAWRLSVLDWHQVHNIWSKKKERAEKKGGKWKLTACENRRKRECLIINFYYSLWAGHIWYSQLETVDCETLHLFTSKIDKAWEWTYNCLIGHWVSKYKWFVWDNHRCCCKLIVCFQLNLAL